MIWAPKGRGIRRSPEVASCCVKGGFEQLASMITENPAVVSGTRKPEVTILDGFISDSAADGIEHIKSLMERNNRYHKERVRPAMDALSRCISTGDRKQEGTLWRDLWDTRRILNRPDRGRNLPAPTLRTRSKDRFIEVPLSPRVVDMVIDGQAKHLRNMVAANCVPNVALDPSGNEFLDENGDPVYLRAEVETSAYMLEKRGRINWTGLDPIPVTFDDIASAYLSEMPLDSAGYEGSMTERGGYEDMIPAVSNLLRRWAPESDLHVTETLEHSRSTEATVAVAAWNLAELAWTTIINLIDDEEERSRAMSVARSGEVDK